jgi:hypothetical protein
MDVKSKGIRVGCSIGIKLNQIGHKTQIKVIIITGIGRDSRFTTASKIGLSNRVSRDISKINEIYIQDTCGG